MLCVLLANVFNWEIVTKLSSVLARVYAVSIQNQITNTVP
jgi:hypothetical protein